MSPAYDSFFKPNDDPRKAALLSAIPGLGQLYNGQPRKGVLFLDVAAINSVFLAVILFSGPISAAMLGLAANHHMRVNAVLIEALAQLKPGKPVSVLIFSMIIAFAAYAIRDAYDNAKHKRRQAIYKNGIIELTEATSGSYIFHASAIIALAILAMFFVVPPQPRRQITEIEFINQKHPELNPKRTHVVAPTPSKAHGKVDKTRPETKSIPAQKPVQKPSTSSKIEARSTSSTSQSNAKTMPTMAVPKPVAPPAGRSSQAIPVQPPTLNTLSNNTASALPTPSLSIRPLNVPTLPTLPAKNHAMAPPVPRLPIPDSLKAGFLNKIGANPLPTAPGSAKNLLAGLPSPSSIIAPVLGSGQNVPVPHPATSETANHSLKNTGNPAPVSIPKTGSNSGPMPTAFGRHKGPTGSGEPDHQAPAPQKAKSGPGSGGLPSLVPSLPKAGIAPNSGNPAQEASLEPPDFGPYMADLQRRIKRAWIPPRGARSRRVKVVFRIHTHGDLSDLKIVMSSGEALQDQAALKAVETAAPFSRLPARSPETVDIEFTFDYNVMTTSGREF